MKKLRRNYSPRLEGRVDWMEDLQVGEVSMVDVAGNRRRFPFFRRALEAPAADGDMQAAFDLAVEVARRDVNVERCCGGCDCAVAYEPPTDVAGNELPAPLIEGGILYFPFHQAVHDFEVAFSREDAYRIAGLLLAKYGDGPYMEIKLPLGASLIEEATTAIQEAGTLMNKNPLLRNKPKETVVPVSRAAGLASLMRAIGFEALMEKVAHAAAPAKPAAKPGKVTRAPGNPGKVELTVEDINLFRQMSTLLLAVARAEVDGEAEGSVGEGVVGAGSDEGAGDAGAEGGEGDAGAEGDEGEGDAGEGEPVEAGVSTEFEGQARAAFLEIGQRLEGIERLLTASGLTAPAAGAGTSPAGTVRRRAVVASRGTPGAGTDGRQKVYRSSIVGDYSMDRAAEFMSDRTKKKLGLL